MVSTIFFYPKQQIEFSSDSSAGSAKIPFSKCGEWKVYYIIN